jgi:purine-binding chemotaxis protein CheW
MSVGHDGGGLAGKYMTFKLGAERYGVEILKVREIIGLMDVTRVPRAPDHVRGVVNLRGKVVPVVDLRRKFGMPACEPTDLSVIVVVQYALEGSVVTMGVLVDEVLEVRSLDAEHIEPPPELGETTMDAQCILGVGKTDRSVVFLLDIGRALGATADAAPRAGA